MIMNEIFNNVPYRIFERGEQYYYAGRILSLEYDDIRNIIRSKVEESRSRQYSVEVRVNNNEVIDYYCNCPHFHGNICKHLVALFLAIINGDHLKILENRTRLYSDSSLYSYDTYGNLGIDDDIASRMNHFDVDEGFSSKLNHFGIDDDFSSRKTSFGMDDGFDSRRSSFGMDDGFDSRGSSFGSVDDGFGMDDGFNSDLSFFDVVNGFDSKLDYFGVDDSFVSGNTFTSQSNLFGFDGFGVDEDFHSKPNLFDVGDGLTSRWGPYGIDNGEDSRLNDIGVDSYIDNGSESEGSDYFKLLESSSKNELIEFILEFSSRDKQLGYELSKRFNLGNSFDIDEIKRLIKNSIKNDYHGDYLNEDDSYYIANELEEILDRYDKLLDKVTCNNIFKNTFEILIETSNILDRNIDERIFTDFRNVIPHAEGLLHTAALYLERYGSIEDKNNAFFNLIKRGFHDDFKHINNIYFFEMASIFVDEHNKEHFYQCFSKFQEKHRNSYEIGSYSVQSIEKDLLKRLEGDDAAYEYMENNIHIDSFAINIISQAFDNQDYKLAQKICLSKIKTIYKEFPESKYNTFLKMWYRILHLIYPLSKEKEEEKSLDGLYKSLANGGSQYYNAIKEVYKKEGIWNEKYSSVMDFISKNLPSNDYMSILASEKEWGLLFDEVKSHPDNIAIYGKDLAKVCPDKAFKIYTDEIIAEATLADNRVMYKEVCDLIKNLYEGGGHKPTNDVIQYLRETYKERPAFQDEINKLEGSLSDLIQFA